MNLYAGKAEQTVSFAAWTTATGAPVTVTSETDGLSLWYRCGVVGAKVPIEASDLATLETAHADGGILVIEGAEHRLDLPDAACAAGVDSVQWGGTATGITIDGGTANLVQTQDQEFQESARIIHRTKGSVWFVSTSGNDANSGLTPTAAKQSLKTVVEAASAGDVVVTGPGTHALGNAKITVPANVRWVGAGEGVTIVTSTRTDGAAVTPGNSSYLADMTVSGTGTTQAGIGTVESDGDAAFTGAVIERVRSIGTGDGFYIKRTSAGLVSATLRDVRLEGGVDGFVILNSADPSVYVEAYDLTVHSYNSAGESNAVAVLGTNSDVRLFNPHLVARASSTACGCTVAAGTVRLFGGRSHTTGAAMYDLRQVGGTLSVAGHDYSPSKTFGTLAITSAAHAAIVDNNLDHLMKAPTAGADMTSEVPDNTVLSRIIANGDTSAFIQATHGLKAIEESIEGTGTGARTVTINVAKGGLAVQGAIVTLTTATDYRRKTTPASGQVVFRVDDATWNVAITYPLHEMDDSDDNPLVVTADVEVTYTLTAQTITPSAAPFVTGYVACYVDGVLTAGVVVDVKPVKHSSAGVLPVVPAVGYVSAISGADGVAQIPNLLLPGASYEGRSGGGKWWAFSVPAAQTSDYAIPRVIGVVS